MATVQIQLTDPASEISETTEEYLVVSRETGGILVLKGEKAIVRIALDRKEAAITAAKLAPRYA